MSMEATAYWPAYVWSPYLQQEVYWNGEYAKYLPIQWKYLQFFILKEVEMLSMQVYIKIENNNMAIARNITNIILQDCSICRKVLV